MTFKLKSAFEYDNNADTATECSGEKEYADIRFYTNEVGARAAACLRACGSRSRMLDSVHPRVLCAHSCDDDLRRRLR